MEARHVECGTQAADAGGGRSVNVLLRRGDWNRGYGKPRLYRAHGERMKFVEARPILDAVRAARKLVEPANAFELVQMRELPAGRYIRTGAVLAAIPCSVIR